MSDGSTYLLSVDASSKTVLSSHPLIADLETVRASDLLVAAMTNSFVPPEIVAFDGHTMQTIVDGATPVPGLSELFHTFQLTDVRGRSVFFSGGYRDVSGQDVVGFYEWNAATGIRSLATSRDRLQGLSLDDPWLYNASVWTAGAVFQSTVASSTLDTLLALDPERLQTVADLASFGSPWVWRIYRPPDSRPRGDEFCFFTEPRFPQFKFTLWRARVQGLDLLSRAGMETGDTREWSSTNSP